MNSLLFTEPVLNTFENGTPGRTRTCDPCLEGRFGLPLPTCPRTNPRDSNPVTADDGGAALAQAVRPVVCQRANDRLSAHPPQWRVLVLSYTWFADATFTHRASPGTIVYNEYSGRDRYGILLASSLHFDAWSGAGRRQSLRQIPRSVRGASPVPARNRQRGPNAFSMTQGNQIQWLVRGS